jgi:hypothetical protein
MIGFKVYVIRLKLLINLNLIMNYFIVLFRFF